jgi:hypothetical protein
MMNDECGKLTGAMDEDVFLFIIHHSSLEEWI